MDLHSPIITLPRVGQTTYALLKKLGLETVHDLLFYFPFRYDDFSRSVSIASLQADTTANVSGEIELIQNKKSFKRRMSITEALIKDETDTLKVIWFNQPFLTRTLKVGDKISLAGRVSENYGQLAMVSPVYEKIYSDELVHTSGLVPNYHLTAALTQKQIRFLIKQIISLADTTEDWLPTEIKKRLNLLDLGRALRQIHFPKNHAEVLTAQRRLAFTELFLRQLKAQMIKRQLRDRRALPIKFQEAATKKFVDSLPFKLTDDQRKAAWEILKDLEKSAPMSRLLEGDVGSGKTLVVILALLNTALNKRQSALMVPTEILAQQHFHSISKLLAAYNFNIALATHHRKDKDWQNADIVIGTQALIQKNIKFKNLALAVIDEQHRFGVAQRKKILEVGLTDETTKSSLTPHFLSLTATPIPRSLALAIYGDLDLSVINQLPTGRQPIITKIVTEAGRSAAYDFIRAQIKAGRQAFVVCPLIDESDKLGAKSAKQEYAKLTADIFPELKIGLLHGRLKAPEKEKVMADFLDNKLQVLVTTAVIEVGVDVPNATMMLIEGAERFGLAQLHQFRGRVGRGGHQSHCFVFPSREEISNLQTIERLEALTRHRDGWELAKIDLKLRGAGELYGTGQSGFPELQIASLFDYANIKKAAEEAKLLIHDDPELLKYPRLKQQLGKWEENAHLE
ncbi:TPA: ATP-dependent DNA helicase RecG [Candidatus Falkowbacteria bacterium]|nr:MAG: ATP-dependent DNA helicase RecG [Candidatus Falkowbacteria bacterium GW2011_GWF2_43_32]HBA36655.1 ATP-dependent DNA helicase RecG [Candidatus Falkowbacteria bacterium]